MSVREWLNLPLPWGERRAVPVRADRLACPRCGTLLQHVRASAARPAHWQCPECWVMYTISAGDFRQGYTPSIEKES